MSETLEIERRFLVAPGAWTAGAGVETKQAYLSLDTDRIVRVRVAGDRGFLTVKGRAAGAARREWEFEIPAAEAVAMMALARGDVVHKTRYRIPAAAGLTWEVDRFHGANDGLVVAEIELPAVDTPLPVRPPWLGAEITGDARYANSELAQRPFRGW